MDYSDELSKKFEELRDSKGYVVLEENTFYKYKSDELEDLLDALGEASKKARGLGHTVTSSVKFTK